MKQTILDKVEECFVKAEKFYGKTFERPKNIIFKTTGTTGGHSNYKRRELMFNIILANENGDDFVNRTVPHEVAHYVQRAVYGYAGVRPHGREWQYVMTKVYGLNPDRCHSYDVTSVKTRKQTRHKYGCPCGKTFNITTTLHNKIKRGSTRICLSCRGRIALIQEGDADQQKLDFLKRKLEKLQNK